MNNITKRESRFWLGIFFLLPFMFVSCSRFNFEEAKSNLLGKLEKQDKDNLLDKLVKNSQNDVLENGNKDKIRWDGQGVVLGEVDSPLFTVETFLETVNSLQSEDRMGSISNLVKMYPDVALNVLQEANPGVHKTDTLQIVASFFDKHWCSSKSGSAHWQTYLVDLSSSARKKNSLLDLKNEFWGHLKNNEPQKALGLNLVNNLPKQTDLVLSAEFYRLEAIALMMNGQIKNAIARLEQAIELIEPASPYQSSRMQLLLGEFYRHQGQAEKWKSNWASAVSLHSRRLAEENLVDPMFWKRAAFLRPNGFDWPEDSLNRMRAFISADEIDASKVVDDGVVWLVVGLQHNRRSEGQHAVLSLKKAEAASSDLETQANLRLLQARSMVLAGQPGAASAILIRLISDHQGEVLADRAQAILGAMKLQNGAIGQGVNLIHSAMKSVDSWPIHERLRAKADYGLALLVLGKETEGLAQLEAVQKQFEARGELDQAYQCAWNRAKYYEKTNQQQLHRVAAGELETIESQY